LAKKEEKKRLKEINRKKQEEAMVLKKLKEQ